MKNIKLRKLYFLIRPPPRFSVYGKVAHSIKTEQFMHGNDFAFLKFESTSAALEAIAGEDGSEFNGGILR